MPSPGNVMGMSARGQTVTRTGTAVSPANASAQMRFIDLSVSGNVSHLVQSAPTNGTFSDEFAWLTGAGPSSSYYVRVTPTSGSFSSSSGVNTWLQLGATLTWARNRTSDTPGTTTVVATVEIAGDPAGAIILASFTLTLNATVLSP